MGHHCQVAAIGRTDTSHAVVRTVRVARIAVVAVFQHHVVVVFRQRQRELAFAVSHPDAEFVAREAAEHHAAVGRNRYADKGALKLVAVVVEHVGTLFVLRIDEVEFHHQLATVAHAER